MAPTSPFGIPSAGGSWYAGSRTALDLEVTYRVGQQIESQDRGQAKAQVHGGGREEENGTRTKGVDCCALTANNQTDYREPGQRLPEGQSTFHAASLPGRKGL